MDWLGTLFLYLHIGGVIVAFGPTIAFPFLAARAAKEPMHGNFTLRASEWLSEKVVEPGAIFVFLMGVGLILTKGYSLVDDLWVTTAIVLFLIALGYSFLVQLPTVRRMISLTDQPRPVVVDASSPGEQPAMAGPGTPGAAGAGPAGPPPEFIALSKKAARGGMFSTVLLFTILALMVVKPF
jgi:hypothetical protein